VTEIREREDFYKMLCTVEVPERANQIISEDPTREGSAELMAFAAYTLETLESEAWTAQPQPVFFRRKLGKPLREVALPVYSLLNEEGALHLFAFHYDPSLVEPEQLEQKTIEREKNRLTGLVELLRESTFDPSSLGDDAAIPHLSALQRFLRSDQCRVIKYFVITNQLKRERCRPEKTKDGKVFTEVIDIERLFRWSKGVASRSDIETVIQDALGAEKLFALRAPKTTDDVTTFLTVLPGRFLAELYENYDNRLLELNVRSYLSAKGGVNKGIQETLKSAERRGFFLPYNNGIVMVVEDLLAQEVGNGVCEIKWLKGIQIVNGGQTTASLFKARRDVKGEDPLQGVFVQAKIIRLDRHDRAAEIVKSISLYANSQNKVEMADLGANEAYHRRVEKLAEKEVDPRNGAFWFYERMRNAYATQLMLETSPSARRRWQERHPKARVITKTELAKYMMAWDRQPSVVARGGQKCFNAFAQSYHVKPIKTDDAAAIEITSDRFKEIIGKVLTYRTTHQIVRGDKERFTSNQINVATYTVAYLSRRVAGELDWKTIWRSQELSPEMRAFLKALARQVAQYIEIASSGRLASEVCKKEGLFDDMCRALAELQSPSDEAGRPLEPIELKGRLDGTEDAVDPDDELNIAEVMSYSSERFAALRAAAESNRDALSEYHLGVIKKLDLLAQAGWPDRPKAKQAKMFLNALAQLENYGLVESSAS
jgi:hypothetical protein